MLNSTGLYWHILVFYNNFTAFEPPREVLDRCIQVYLADHQISMREIRAWAYAHCESFIWAEQMDTSDVSYEFDTVSAFYFYSEADATLFRLKWK